MIDHRDKQIRTVKSDELLTKARTSNHDFKFSLSSKNQSSFKQSLNANSNQNLNNSIRNPYEVRQKIYKQTTHKIMEPSNYAASQYRGRNLLNRNSLLEDNHTSENAIKQISSNVRLQEFLYKIKLKFVHFLQELDCAAEQILKIKEIDNENEFLSTLIQTLMQVYKGDRKKITGSDNNEISKQYLQKARQQLKEAYELQQKVFARHRKLKSQYKLIVDKNAQLQNQLNQQKEENYKLSLINKKNVETIENLNKQLSEKDKNYQQITTNLEAKANKYRNLYEQQQNSKNQIKQRFQNAQFQLEEYIKMEQQYSNQIEILKKEILKWRDRCKWLEQQHNNKQPKELDQYHSLKRQVTELKEANQQYKHQRLQQQNKIEQLQMQNRHLQARLSEISFENQRQLDQEKKIMQITIMEWKQKLVDTIEQYQKLLKEKDERS